MKRKDAKAGLYVKTKVEGIGRILETGEESRVPALHPYAKVQINTGDLTGVTCWLSYESLERLDGPDEEDQTDAQ